MALINIKITHGGLYARQLMKITLRKEKTDKFLEIC